MVKRAVMLHCLIILICFAFAANVKAQTNLYASSGNSTLSLLQIIESNDRVYYSSFSDDTLSGVASRTYYFSAVDKKSGALIRTVQILRDTAFNVYEQYQSTAISYCLSVDKKRIHIILVSDKDSSANNTSELLKYPKTINYLQLDTGLNVTIFSKPLISFNKLDKYAFYTLGFSQPTQTKQITLSYTVRDTFISGGVNANAVAEKLLTVDDTGKLISDKFLGYEPKGMGQFFYNHFSFGTLYKTPVNKYASLVRFDDSVFAGKRFNLFLLDSNMTVVDTFDYPSFIDFGTSLPGKKEIGIDAWAVHLLYLPSGSLIRSSVGFFKDVIDDKQYTYYALAKGDSTSGFIPTKLYFPPKADTNDYEHSSNHGFTAATYNSTDNRLYAFTSTKSNPTIPDYCTNGMQNAGQLTCLDTNLNEKWVKYILPKPGYCIQSFSVYSPDGRKGVLMSGRAFSISDPNNQALWKPFIYYIDSSTKVGVNDLESPVLVSNPFTVYPNPARGQLSIDNTLGNSFQYSIINAVGQVIKKGEATGKTTTLDIISLVPGVYLMTIHTSDSTDLVQRFLVR